MAKQASLSLEVTILYTSHNPVTCRKSENRIVQNSIAAYFSVSERLNKVQGIPALIPMRFIRNLCVKLSPMIENEETTDYRISIAGDPEYMIIKYFGPMTTEIALKSGPELMQRASGSDIRRFMFDMRESTNIQSVTNNYYFAYEHIQTFNFPRNSLSAFLVQPSDNSHDFITTAFKNAGYAVEKFTSEKEAVIWLNS